MLVMAAMLSIVVVTMLLVIRAHRPHWNHRYWRCLHDGSGGVAAPHCSASCASDGCAQDRAVLAANVVTDGSAGRSADCAADDGTAVNGIGIHAGGKEQDDC